MGGTIRDTETRDALWTLMRASEERHSDTERRDTEDTQKGH